MDFVNGEGGLRRLATTDDHRIVPSYSQASKGSVRLVTTTK
jgi:hypothetical protein